jgi:uncharacterized protein YndB with AHSA1/START domain
VANPLKMLKLKPTHFQFIQQVPIDAPPARVWKVLLDMPGWFRFDSKDTQRHGKMEPWVGGRFHETTPDGASWLHATVTHMEPNKLLRLSGSFGMTHLPVCNAYIFELSPRGKGTLLKFCQRTFGALTPDVSKQYRGGWKKLTQQLKAIAEQRR